MSLAYTIDPLLEVNHTKPMPELRQRKLLQMFLVPLILHEYVLWLHQTDRIVHPTIDT
jgi:hypothetical protein